MYSLPSDIGNRITELSKSVFRIHSDMKVVQQLLMNDGHVSRDALTSDGSSILGKYIIGAKNNFRGFASGQEQKSPSLKVTVHHGEEEVNKEKVNPKSDIQENQVDECGADRSMKVTDSDLVTMEEGRANLEPGDKDEAEKKEEVETDENENTGSEAKEDVVARTSFNYAEEKVNTEATQDQAEDILTNTITEQGETITVSNEKIDTKKLVKKFEDVELQEKNVEGRWVKSRKFEKTGVTEVNEKPGAKKTIPSPTESCSSQDTGFGSQEGEGSIDGTVVKL